MWSFNKSLRRAVKSLMPFIKDTVKAVHEELIASSPQRQTKYAELNKIINDAPDCLILSWLLILVLVSTSSRDDALDLKRKKERNKKGIDASLTIIQYIIIVHGGIFNDVDG